MDVLETLAQADDATRRTLRENQRHGSKQPEHKFFFSQLGYYKGSTRAFYETDWRRRKRDAEKMGSSEFAGKRGRYEEKGGGKQVGSFFDYSSDNEKIKACYGNYNFWSWLRYWFLDTENQVQLMLIDKGYYDYDYSEPSEDYKFIKQAAKTDDELMSKLSKLGFGKAKKPNTAEELQRAVMKSKV